MLFDDDMEYRQNKEMKENSYSYHSNASTDNLDTLFPSSIFSNI